MLLTVSICRSIPATGKQAITGHSRPILYTPFLGMGSGIVPQIFPCVQQILFHSAIIMSRVILYRRHVVSRTEKCRLYYQYNKTKYLQFLCFAFLHTPTYTTLPKATTRRKDVMTLVFRNEGDDIPNYYEIPICVSSLRARGACIQHRGQGFAATYCFLQNLLPAHHECQPCLIQATTSFSALPS